MARSRNLKPSFFTNDKLGEIDPLGRLLFQGLWCIADREGRLEDRPKRIKAEVLPYDLADVNSLLDLLCTTGFILRYSIGNARYIQVLAFRKHQNPHIKEAVSTIPAPDEHGASPMQAPEAPEVAPEIREQAGLIPSLLIPDSQLVGSDSLYPLSDTKERNGGHHEMAGTFVEFWTAYPRKKSKGSAEKAWDRINPSSVLAKQIVSAVARATTCPDWQRDGGMYIPYPATWLNAKGWEDAIESGPPQDVGEVV